MNGKYSITNRYARGGACGVRRRMGWEDRHPVSAVVLWVVAAAAGVMAWAFM